MVSAEPLGGGDIAQTSRMRLADGRMVVVKTLPDAPPGFFAAEARGLEVLRVAGAPPVPEVLAVADDLLVLTHVAPGPPTPRAATEFGAALARLHTAECPGFGAPADGYIATLPLDNTPAPTWAEFYMARRIEPYARAARAAGRLDARDAADLVVLAPRLVERVPDEPPARLHGDLWSGNVLWGKGSRAWLIDPAAHGGHRESDLAMLALFGVPHLGRILKAYDEAAPLAAGWRDRVGIHQLFPLLVHALLFGGGYGARAAATARALA